MSKLIALCDGHGMETPGKRSPVLSNGSFMHENEFNRRVVALLDVELKRCGFNTLLVAPTDTDTPLEQRTKLANSKKADLYLSVHANALTDKQFGSHGGIETYVFNNEKSFALGEIIHKYIIQGTKLRNRGVKDGSHLWVIRKTIMPAVLVECGFMDNPDEIKLLLSEDYRKECAIELAKGVCEYFSVNYVSGEVPKPVHTVSYYQKTTYTGDSIVTALKTVYVDSSFSSRCKIAVRNGIVGYRGSASQNTQMLNLLKQGKLIK